MDACCQFHDGQSGLDAESPQISILYRHGFKELSNGHLEHVGQLAKLTRMRDLLTRFPSTYAWRAGHTNQIAQLPLREAFRASGLAQSRQIEGVTHNDVSVTSDRVGAENLIIRFRGAPTNLTSVWERSPQRRVAHACDLRERPTLILRVVAT